MLHHLSCVAELVTELLSLFVALSSSTDWTKFPACHSCSVGESHLSGLWSPTRFAPEDLSPLIQKSSSVHQRRMVGETCSRRKKKELSCLGLWELTWMTESLHQRTWKHVLTCAGSHVFSQVSFHTISSHTCVTRTLLVSFVEPSIRKESVYQ